MQSKEKNLVISIPSGNVSALIDEPKHIEAGFVLAHGAGAGMGHSFMRELALQLADQNFVVLRFNFLYMEQKRKRTDSPAAAVETIVAATELLADRFHVPIFAGGKSFGSRMTTTAASQNRIPAVKGIVCFGFPLHPADQPSIKRADHLAHVKVPILFLQGTKDALCDLALMKMVCRKIANARLHVVDEADHGFAVLKRSGRTSEDVMKELVTESKKFVDGLMKSR